MSDDVFQRYSAYYDLLYRDKDYSGEALYVASRLKAAVPDCRRIVEFGCGTGRHGRLLAGEGFQVVGIERSAEMVEESRRETGLSGTGTFEAVVGDIRSAKAEGSVEAVIALFHVVSYVTENEDLLQLFSNAARHLGRGGVFFFDVWHGPAVLTERPSVRIKRVEDETRRLTRIAEPELDSQAGVVTVHYTIFAETKDSTENLSFQESHRMRYLFPTEIALLASQTGFWMEHSEEFMTRAEPSARTWGIAYLLRKLC